MDPPRGKGLKEYDRSKTLAERAAWELAEQSGGKLELISILPGMILGPVMTRSISGSVELISRMLTGRVPALPRVGFSIVDVRDLADLHVQAMLAPEAEGQRTLGVADFLWMADTYPAILPPSSTCPKLGINDADAIIMRQGGDILAKVTRASAKEAAVSLVDMAQLSLGHDACADTPWVNGAVPAQGAKFHPTTIGASATAEAIRAALHPSS